MIRKSTNYCLNKTGVSKQDTLCTAMLSLLKEKLSARHEALANENLAVSKINLC